MAVRWHLPEECIDIFVLEVIQCEGDYKFKTSYG